jgi:tetratricopeptide (TPR) repeat protein
MAIGYGGIQTYRNRESGIEPRPLGGEVLDVQNPHIHSPQRPAPWARCRVQFYSVIGLAPAGNADYYALMSDDPKGPDNRAPLSDTAPDAVFMKEFEKVIQSYAEAVTDDKPEEAQNAAMQALLMAGEEALKNPAPSLLLKQEAGDCEDKGDWAAAEVAYRKVLALEESSGNFGMIAKAQMDLSRLLRLLGRLDEAWQFACQATVAARRTEIFPVLVMALNNESLCALDRGDYAAALKAAAEGVQVIEPGKMYELMRAQSLVTRARCLLVTGDPAGADLDLTSSWETLKARFGSASMPGPTWALANWWQVKSQLEEKRSNVGAAREAMAKALESFRQLQGPYALFAVARALERVCALSSLGGDPIEAERASTEAKAIRRDLHIHPED